MPYNSETHMIELENRVRVAPHFFQLGDMQFATLTEIPNDILRDMQSRANFIQHHPFMDEEMKRAAIKEIADRGAGRAEELEYLKGDRWMTEKPIAPVPPVKYTPKPMRFADELRRLNDEFEKFKLPPLVLEPWVPSSLRANNYFHREGILAQARDMQPLTPDDAIELKRPKKHKTIIQL